MESLGFTTSITSMSTPTTSNYSTAPIPTTRTRNGFCLFNVAVPFTSSTRSRNLWVRRRMNKVSVLASKGDENNLDPWDQMELKFGKLIGEDPKLTLAKIMGRKANPDTSYVEIEKSFYSKKGKTEVKEVPFEVSKEEESSSSSNGLNLVRPVPKQGLKFKSDDKKIVSELKKPSQTLENLMDRTKSSVPNVILRKPTIVNEEDVPDKPSKVRIKRNLSLTINNQREKEKFSDMTLLRKPEITSVDADPTKMQESAYIASDGISEDVKLTETNREEQEAGDFTLIKKPGAVRFETKNDQDVQGSQGVSAQVNTARKESEEISESFDTLSLSQNVEDDNSIGSQLQEKSHVELSKEEISTRGVSDEITAGSSLSISTATSLLQKPKRLDQLKKGILNNDRADPAPTPVTSGSEADAFDLGSLSAISMNEEFEDADWTKAEDLAKIGERADVELISCSTRGFVVSFRSLIGFLPYRNLSSKFKFLAFESWLRQKGLDPSKYKQNLGVLGSYDAINRNSSPSGRIDPPVDPTPTGEISPDIKLEDLLKIYDNEKLKFLSSFVGQKIKVNVVVANRKLKKLLFSVRQKEKEELVEKKRSLMAKLRVGDVVKCCIKKIAYFGIFVEVEGVPALIHQSEVSWDATLDPVSSFKIDQIVDAKVHQLDFALERIFLSLKETTPDPLIEALESVVGEPKSLDGKLEAAEADTEWPEVESLIKELEQVKGVQTVSKGRYFLSPGLAPTFQVYMASMFENQYKLLARSGNKVQEVIVESLLDKEEMKSIILTCTNRVG